MAGRCINVAILTAYSIKYGNLVELMIFRMKLPPKVSKKWGLVENWRIYEWNIII